MRCSRPGAEASGFRFLIPMRGNEGFQNWLYAVYLFTFLIPMRGNEETTGLRIVGRAESFLIPMRGNELAKAEVIQAHLNGS